jgi:hypothetical protein
VEQVTPFAVYAAAILANVGAILLNLLIVAKNGSLGNAVCAILSFIVLGLLITWGGPK